MVPISLAMALYPSPFRRSSTMRSCSSFVIGFSLPARPFFFQNKKSRRTDLPGISIQLLYNATLFAVFPAYSFPYPFSISRKCTFEGASVLGNLPHRDFDRPSPFDQILKFFNNSKLESIGRIAVLIPCFFIMAAFTKRLPIAFIPEQLLVSSVRNDMIHNRCFGQLSCLFTFSTEWMSHQVMLPGFLPLASVPTLAGILSVIFVQSSMLLTILSTSGCDQLRTHRMLTWNARSVWHCHLSFQKGAAKG